MKKLLLIIMSTLLFVSCSSLPTLENSNLQVIAAKSYQQPPKGKSGVYIYRPDKLLGSAIRRDIYINGISLGKPAPGTFFYFLVDSGKDYLIETDSEFQREGTKFTAVEGENFFFEQHIKMGIFVAGMGVKQMLQGNVMQDINKSKMIYTPYK